MVKINVAHDFTRYPSGRYKKNGGTSGEEFRERFLEDPVRRGDAVTVELDGTIGYGSSFLEEAFGGLVRRLGVPATQILNHLKIESKDQALIEEIMGYIEDAGREFRG